MWKTPFRRNRKTPAPANSGAGDKASKFSLRPRFHPDSKRPFQKRFLVSAHNGATRLSLSRSIRKTGVRQPLKGGIPFPTGAFPRRRERFQPTALTLWGQKPFTAKFSEAELPFLSVLGNLSRQASWSDRYKFLY